VGLRRALRTERPDSRWLATAARVEEGQAMSAEIIAATPEAIARAAAALRADEVVGMPTETVYGLAGNALSPHAVGRIFSVKERPTFDPLIVHVAPEVIALERLEHAGLVDLGALNSRARAIAQKLIARFWPGPLTLVLPRGERVPDLVTSGLPGVAVRMPQHPVAQALIRASQLPLAAPSANRFGRISPTSAADVFAELGTRIALILDGGPCSVGLESTVVALTDEGATLLRPGGVSRADLEALLGFTLGAVPASGAVPLAPGMLASHYAPRKAMHLLTGPIADGLLSATWSGALPQTIGVLIEQGNAAMVAEGLSRACSRTVRVEVLSSTGDLAEAARRLFGAMRALDASDAELLFAELPASADGLGHAIADRLRRACAR
jgi:L-threonylcarbamoyladenylate synthase